MKTSGESIAEDDKRLIEGMVNIAIIKDCEPILAL